MRGVTAGAQQPEDSRNFPFAFVKLYPCWKLRIGAGAHPGTSGTTAARRKPENQAQQPKTGTTSSVTILARTLNLDPPMILKTGSRSPRSDPVTPSRRPHLPGAAANSANQGADLLKHR